MLSIKIKDFLYYIGVNDRETSLFEGQWPIENGISYNSYLLKGEKTCLLDTVKITKVDEFEKKLEEALDGRDLDYLVIHHMEPDHSGSIEIIRKLYPNVTIVGNMKTKNFLENFYGITDNFQVVKEGDILDLGDRKLKFFMTPMVHWPESMVSFEESSGILFSQDAFGTYGALDGPIFDDQVDLDHYLEEGIRYYTNIVGKFSMMVQNSLKKLSTLEIKMVCPVHGPVWRENPQTIIDLYDKLSSYQTKEGVVVVYASMYGNTSHMAEHIAYALGEEGVEKVKVFDVSKTDPSYIISEIWKYKGLVLGSCTYNNSLFPKMRYLVDIIEENKIKNHALAIFGSYSWSGGALKELKEFGENSQCDLVEKTVETLSAPSKEDYKGLEEIAKELAKKIKE